MKIQLESDGVFKVILSFPFGAVAVLNGIYNHIYLYQF